MNIFWFRRDLRIDDNKGFFEALSSDNQVLPIFIFDDKILSELPKNDARVNFIHSRLEIINQELKKTGKSLAIFHGEPETIWKQILSENQINKVFFNHDYEPYARERDKTVYELLQSNNIEIKILKTK